MLETFQKKVEQVAESYADLVLSKIKDTQTAQKMTPEIMGQVNEGIGGTVQDGSVQPVPLIAPGTVHIHIVGLCLGSVAGFPANAVIIHSVTPF